MSHRMERRPRPDVPAVADRFTPEVVLGRDGILRIDYSQHDRITLGSIERARAIHAALCPDRKVPVLLQGSRVGSVEYKAQRYLSAPEVCAGIAAGAIVVKSFLERHLARMFLIYHRPPYPVQVFSEEASALAWLRGFLPAA